MTPLEGVVARVAAALEGPCDVVDGTPLLVAISGGADSVLLLRVLAELRVRWPVVAAVFVDHGLRDVEAERECARATAEELAVPFVARSVTLSEDGNLQQNARRARYAVLAEEAARHGALICTGHTLTDQAETVLSRLVRGAGLRGLAGIRAREGLWVRPLLSVSRDEGRSFQWAFADDPSNAGDGYQRNRLRHHVLPLLRQENPRADEALAGVAEAASAELELLDAIGEALSDEASLSGAPEEFAEVIVRWRLRRDAAQVPPPGRSAVRDLAARLVAGVDGRVSLGSGVAGVSAAGRLSMEPDADDRLTLVAPRPGHYSNSHAALSLLPQEGGSGPMNDHLDTQTAGRAAPAVETFWIDPSTVTWPITLRRWRYGDTAGVPRGWLLLDGVGKVIRTPGVATHTGSAASNSSPNPTATLDQDSNPASPSPENPGTTLLVRLQFFGR